MKTPYRRLRDLRTDHDMTQQQIAEYLGIMRPQYTRYENGDNDIPTRVLIRLAVLYNTSVDYILGITNNPKPYRDIED